MFNLIRTILGILFFFLVFGVVLIKNKPKEFEIVLEQSIDYPFVNYIDYLQSTPSQEWITALLSKNEAFYTSSRVNRIEGLQKNQYGLKFIYPEDEDFTLEERWVFSSEKKSVQLLYNYTLGFRNQFKLLRNPQFNDTLRSILIKRFENTQQAVAEQYQQHRWQYNGKTTLPLTYYLTLEGNSPWNTIKKDTELAFKKIRDFAKTADISSLGKTFILYPVLSDSVVRWQAVIEVDRFYRTNRRDIRCRSYKGGKALQLTHQGTNDFLKDSWEILQDSLVSKIQAYPAIQFISKENDSIVNTLNRTTQLYMPIQ
jgi:hypothetical protein